MVTTSLINRLQRAIDLVEQRRLWAGSLKIVKVCRGYDEHPDTALDRHYAAHPEDRGAGLVIFKFDEAAAEENPPRRP